MNGLHLSAYHVPGALNNQADALSRSGNEDLEWSLSTDLSKQIVIYNPDLQVDLFASGLNAKHNVSRFSDANAMAIDAFSLTWNQGNYYKFFTFQLAASHTTEGRGGQDTDSDYCTSMADSSMVANFNKSYQRTVLLTAKSSENPKIGTQSRPQTSSEPTPIESIHMP